MTEELLKKFRENVQESIKILKDTVEQLGIDFNKHLQEFNDLKEFLIFNNKKYRKFINKKRF